MTTDAYDVIDVAERAWNGDDTAGLTGVGEVADGIHFLHNYEMANVVAHLGTAGLSLVDAGSIGAERRLFESCRRLTSDPLHTVVYTHGHLDHVGGVGPFDEAAASSGIGRPRVVAHEAVVARFDRYLSTAGYNTAVNRRQWSQRGFVMPTSYRYPDETYRDEVELDLGERVVLRHGRGETDDHTWVHLPERGVLCTGDFFIWVFPNAGNPQKAARYASEWATALRAMAAVEASVLLPGHGQPIFGVDRIREALTTTAAALEELHERTIAAMNAGCTLDEVVREVRIADERLSAPYLRQIYDDQEFIVRNVWRLFGGWYDGDIAHLRPSPAGALAAELAALAGGVDVLLRRAEELGAAGDLRLAGHLVELAHHAAPDDSAVHEARATLNEARAEADPSFMARGLFAAAAVDSRSQTIGTHA